MQVQQGLSPALWHVLALLTISVIANYIDRGNFSAALALRT
jgi:hypothetical protein